MEVLHVVAGVEEGGGIGQSVPRLCSALAELGHRVTLATSDWRVSEAACAAERAGVRLMLMRRSHPWRLWFSWDMLVKLPGLVRSAEIVHVHSNWTFPVWWTCLWVRLCGKPLVMSPRGCLSPERMRRSSLKKRLAGFCFDRRCLRYASVLHATCQAERREIEVYLGERETETRPIIVVPNGVDVKEYRAISDSRSVEQRWPACHSKRKILFLGRIDPIKGLDLLVSAWGRMGEQHREWHLLVAGPDENGYSAQVEAMIKHAGVSAQTTLCGPVYGEYKRTLLNAVDLFVLPTYNENFGIVVAEALACGVPVITTKGAPWQELETHRCGWWIDIGVEPLSAALRKATMLSDDARRAMGKEGRKLVDAKYRWVSVAEQIDRAYQLLPRKHT